MPVPAKLLLAGAGVFVAGVWGGAYVYGGKKCVNSSGTCSISGHWFDNYENALKYDAELARTEARINMPRLRAKLMSCIPPQAHVLEVACGSGFNVPVYAKLGNVLSGDSCGIQSLTLTDSSDVMLGLTRSKAKQCFSTPAEHQNQDDVVRTRKVSVEELTLTFLPESFDCVVDTFGLCSFTDPDTALKQMLAVLKPGGTLLLLEHGRASSTKTMLQKWLTKAVNFWLDRNAESHALKWGCQWNRQIRDIVLRHVGKNKNDVELCAFEKHHLGTTYLFVLRKASVSEGS